MTTDEELILEVQGGSEVAFAELFQRYRQQIYAFFRRRLENPARAEELAQETFLGVLRGSVRYEPRALFRTYLYGVSLNILMAERRRVARELNRSGTLGATTGTNQCESPEQAIWIKRAMEQLEASDREIVLLREYEGLSYREIALLLRLPINTVRSRLFRARMVLKDILVPHSRD